MTADSDPAYDAMTLTEFLLARIAEDEAEARNVRDWNEAQPPRSGAWIVMPTEMEDGAFAPARVLAECAAKRTIVDLHADGTPWCDCGHWDTVVHGDSAYETCDTLRALASVYGPTP